LASIESFARTFLHRPKHEAEQWRQSRIARLLSAHKNSAPRIQSPCSLNASAALTLLISASHVRANKLGSQLIAKCGFNAVAELIDIRERRCVFHRLFRFVSNIARGIGLLNFLSGISNYPKLSGNADI